MHGVGGVVGALLTGVFAFTPVAGALAGNFGQLGKQAVAVIVAVVFAGVGTMLIALLVKKLFGLRVQPQQELDGLDLAIHGERGYHQDLN